MSFPTKEGKYRTTAWFKIQFISIVNCYKQSVKENNQGKKYITTHKVLSTLLPPPHQRLLYLHLRCYTATPMLERSTVLGPQPKDRGMSWEANLSQWEWRVWRIPCFMQDWMLMPSLSQSPLAFSHINIFSLRFCLPSHYWFNTVLYWSQILVNGTQ